MRALLFSVLFSLVSAPAVAQQGIQPLGSSKTGASADLGTAEKTERGWFFFEDHKKPDEEPDAEAPKKSIATPAPKKAPEDTCSKATTWTAACGFVEPGTDFDFQAKQRDALLVQMSMSKNDPKAVEQFQYYMRWVMGRASEVANLWAFNMAQNPDLDPQAKQPISTFGIRMMTDVQSGAEKEIYQVIKEEGGMLVFFTKSDCAFCHSMVPSMLRVSRDTGLPVRNAALDSACLPAFIEGCLAGAATQAPAAALAVTIVPTVFLYVKPNTWIRVSTGITDDVTLKSRIFSFFSAYRSAMLKGINNAQKGRPSVDFSFAEETSGTAKGVAKKEGVDARVPTSAEITNLLGKP